MILGQACGVAAAQAIDENTKVQTIAVTKLIAKLKNQKAVLSPAEVPMPKAGRSMNANNFAGILIDDVDAAFVGDWTHSSANGNFVGAGYRHDNNDGKGQKSVKYVPKLEKAGTYEVYMLYTAHTNRATNVKVTVKHAAGEKTTLVNQQMVHGGAGEPLGVFPLAAGEAVSVEISNAGTTGYVVADAVRFVLAK
jgi:hypothetical protein